MKAHFRLAKSKELGTEFLIEGRQVIGRASAGWNLVLRGEDREIPLGVGDALVSRQHASLYFEGGQLMIRDVGSLNGTAVNGRLLPQWVKRIGSAPLLLKDGAIIKIGNTEIEITIHVTPAYDGLSTQVTALESDLNQGRSPEDVRGLANSFRIVLDIYDRCCSTNTGAKDLHGRLGLLKQYVADEAMVAEIDDLQRRISSKLDHEEFLEECLVWQIKDFCHRFVTHASG